MRPRDGPALLRSRGGDPGEMVEASPRDPSPGSVWPIHAPRASGVAVFLPLTAGPESVVSGPLREEAEEKTPRVGSEATEMPFGDLTAPGKALPYAHAGTETTTHGTEAEGPRHLEGADGPAP